MIEKQARNTVLIRVDNMNCYAKVTSHIVMVGHLNFGHALFGGLLVQWVDEAASIYVMRRLKTRSVVTKKISEVIYDEPTHLGDVLEILMRVSKVGKSSITIECVVHARKIEAHEKTRTILNCTLVFVKVDGVGRPQAHNFQLEDEEDEQEICLDTK